MPPSDAEVAIAAAEAGAEILRRAYRTPLTISPKSGTDFATNADLDAEHAILEVITAARPDDVVEGEETGRGGGTTTTRRWLVDPLCGTRNFAAQTPLAAVNVALVDGSGTTVAAVADPIGRELFWTAGERVLVRDASGSELAALPASTSRLVDVNCDGPIDRPFIGPNMIGGVLHAGFGPRVMSSTLAVAWVAVGRRAGYVSDGRFTGDVHFAAGIALCRAAGCIVTDFRGDDLKTGRGLIIGADATTHGELLDVIAPHLAQVTG